MIRYNRLFILILLWPWLSFDKTTITTSVDRNPVNLNDSFQIIFKADDTPDDDPDLSPLEQDFTVLNQSQSSSKSWMNGRFSSTIQWTVNVIAKHAGTLTIPSIAFGSDHSNAMTVTITDQPDTQGLNNEQELFLDVSAEPEQPYLQAQVIYTLRLYTRVDIAQARLTEPELADAVVEKLGDDSNYNTQVNGVDYSVTERRYAIFPQKTGELTIQPLQLTAEILTNSSMPRFNGFFNQQMAKTKRLNSKPITLQVQAIPSNANGKAWLPAKRVELSEQWSGDISSAKAGEPITRTLTLTVDGNTVAQLPELAPLSQHSLLKSYPDQPVLKEQKNSDGLTAFRQEKIALLPNKAGQYKLPEIAIPWFNTQTKQMELAKLPETVLTAVGDVATTPVPVQTPVAQAQQAAPLTQTPAPVTADVTQQQPTNDFWPWLSAFLGLGWLITLVILLTQRTKPKHHTTQVAVPEQSQSTFQLKHLQVACDNNNPHAAKAALLTWGQHEFGVNSLGAIAAQVDARLRDEILRLNDSLYAQDPKPWQGKPLLKAFNEQQARSKLNKTSLQPLQPLYRL